MISIYNVCALQLKQTSAAVADKKLKLISRVGVVVVVVVAVDVVVVLVRIEILEQRARDRLRLF